jgi:membrane protease YdiL (CAAX protease family)
VKAACVKAISATQPVSRKQQQLAVPPLGVVGSVVYFGIPAAGLSASIRWVVPLMVRRGFGGLTILNIGFGILAALLLVAALVAFRLEGRPPMWTAFRDRMRLSRPSGKDWLWTLAALVLAFGATVLIAPVADAHLGLRLVTIPAETQAFGNSMRAGFPETELSGRWDVLLWLVFSLAVLNIAGEELWWRGIILPRQEVVLGRWAWALNGILWNLFHIGRYETVGSIVIVLPLTLSIPYLAQRTRNTWPGMVVHLIFNTLGMIAVFKRVIG